MSQEERHSGPFVRAAFLCEKVLLEADKVPSFIRAIDRLTATSHDAEAPDAIGKLPWHTNMVIDLVSGDAKGRSELRLTLETPDGRRRGLARGDIHFDGGNNGTRVNIDLNLEIAQEGVYWFDVFVDDMHLTRIPLEVRYQRLPAPRRTEPG